MRRNWKAVLVVVASLSLVFSACGGDSEDKDILSPAAPELPAKIKSAGEIVIGSDIEYPPMESFKEGTQDPEGFDIDLGNALAKELGVKAKFVNDTNFEGIILAMNTGRYDIIISSMTDNATRQQSADFLDYLVAGTSMLVQKGNPKQIAELDDLCGNTVAVQKGTVQDLETLTPLAETCGKANKNLNVLRLEKDVDALQQVKIGRAVATLEDTPVAGYNAKTSGNGEDFEVVGESIASAPIGIAMPKDSPLKALLQKALTKLIQNGTYTSLIKKWGLEAGAVKVARFNGGT